MPPRQKRPAAQGAPAADAAPKPAGKAARTTAEPSKTSAASSLDDLRAKLQERLQALNREAEAGMQEQITECITKGIASVTAKAKEHHAAVNAELQRSLDLQQQVKTQHDTAISEVRRMAAEAGHALERDRDLTDMVKKAQQAALEDVKKLQAKYTARS